MQSGFDLRGRALALVLFTALAACSAGGGGGGSEAPRRDVPTPQREEATTPESVDASTIAPNALTPTVDGIAPSVDRITMDKAIARAEREKKMVLLDVSAAWCGPCNNLAYELHSKPETLQRLTDAGFIFVKFEFEATTRSGAFAANDFLPSLTHFFPSHHLYAPGIGWTALGSANSVDSLMKILANAGKSHKMSTAELNAALEQAATGQTLDPVTDAKFSATTMGLSSLYTYAEARDLISVMSAVGTKYPDSTAGGTAAMAVQFFLPDYFAVEAVSIKTLKVDFPTLAPTLIDLSHEEFRGGASLLGDRMAGRVRKIGLKQAAAQCPQAWQEMRAQLVAGSLSNEGFSEKLAIHDRLATETCAGLMVRANGVTDFVKTEVAKLDKAKMGDWVMLALLGQLEESVASAKRQYEGMADYYAKHIEATQKELDEAVTAGDQKKIEEKKLAIEMSKYQAKHHAEVDAEIEQALRAGEPVRSLKVIN